MQRRRVDPHPDRKERRRVQKGHRYRWWTGQVQVVGETPSFGYGRSLNCRVKSLGADECIDYKVSSAMDHMRPPLTARRKTGRSS